MEIYLQSILSAVKEIEKGAVECSEYQDRGRSQPHPTSALKTFSQIVSQGAGDGGVTLTELSDTV